jgi:hypothetical protein
LYTDSEVDEFALEEQGSGAAQWEPDAWDAEDSEGWYLDTFPMDLRAFASVLSGIVARLRERESSSYSHEQIFVTLAHLAVFRIPCIWLKTLAKARKSMGNVSRYQQGESSSTAQSGTPVKSFLELIAVGLILVGPGRALLTHFCYPFPPPLWQMLWPSSRVSQIGR